MLDVRLDNYQGVIDRTHPTVRWGLTDYVAAMRNVIDQHQAVLRRCPALVIFQTDGAPDDQRSAERMLRDAPTCPYFWAFVGFGGNIRFLEKLDDLGGRAVDNASFFHARDPHRTTTSSCTTASPTSTPAGWPPPPRPGSSDEPALRARPPHGCVGVRDRLRGPRHPGVDRRGRDLDGVARLVRAARHRVDRRPHRRPHLTT
jgi:hypothetical protein